MMPMMMLSERKHHQIAVIQEGEIDRITVTE